LCTSIRDIYLLAQVGTLGACLGEFKYNGYT
jgi:hypothetical protein